MSFKDMTVGKKIKVGFGIVIALLVLISTVGYFSLSSSSDGVNRYRAIARNTNNIGRVHANLLMLRMKVKDFLITSSEEDHKAFDEYLKKTSSLTKEAYEMINNPERKKLVEELQHQIKEYDEGFQKVIKFQDTRNDLLNNAANVYGPKIEKNLTAILNSARRDNDMTAAYYASMATQNLLLARLYVMKFLDTNSQDDVDKVNHEFEELEGSLSTLDKELQNRGRRQLLAKVIDDTKKYEAGFAGIAKAIQGRNEIVANTLNMLGKKAAEEIEEIKLQYKNEQDKLGPQIVKANNTSMLISIIAALIAIAAGIFLSIKIAQAIVQPLLEMVQAANGLAEGDLDQNIQADSQDEIGELATSFNSLIESQLQLAGAAEKVGKGDLTVEVHARSAKDTLSIELGKMITGLRDADRIQKKQADYQNVGVENLVKNMQKVADGDLNIDTSVAKGDADTKLFEENFSKLNQALDHTGNAIKNLAKDAIILADAAVAGKLETRADATAHKGDYRKIIDGVNRTLDAVLDPINEASAVLEGLAGRDLTARVKGNYQGGHAKIKENLNATATALDDAMAQVAEAAEQVASAGNQIASSSQAVAEGASEQASSLEETSSSLEEMASMTKQNAENANQANSSAQQAKTIGDEGITAMNSMSEAMSSIKDSAKGTAAIIKDINEIAFQTNLLALNAAVEAARAGEAGRGFAVVAEEVRNLALRSKEAAAKTEDLINESVNLSENGENISNEVNAKLTQIVESVGQVSDIIGEITIASNEQSRGIEQVNKAVAEMDKVTQQNAANSEESSSGSEELSSQAQELAAMVGRFKVSSSMSGASSFGSSSKKVAVKAKKGGEMVSSSIALSPEDIIPMDSDPDFKDF